MVCVVILELAKNISTPHYQNLILKQLKPNSKKQEITVLAEHRPKGKLEYKTVGKLFALPNTKAHRKKVDILLVNVKTINAKGGSKNGLTANNRALQKNNLTQFLNQARIKPKLASRTLDLTTAKTVAGIHSHNDILGSKFGSLDTVNNVDKYFMGLPGSKVFNNYFRIYFFNVSASSFFGQASGIGNHNRAVCVYKKGLIDNTCAHELLHAMGLHHTFAGKGLFAFDKFKTDNIMDYSDMKGLPVIQTYKWQWTTLRTNTAVTAE